jgi:predicted HTH transcriptional regulator
MATVDIWPPSIDEILMVGETQTIEFKSSLSLMREAFEQLCGMVNADTAKGIVVFGVAPDGAVIGITDRFDAAQQKLSANARDLFVPRIGLEMIPAERDGKQVLIVCGKRAAGVPYHEYRGRAYIREGASSRQLSASEKQARLVRLEVGRTARLSAARMAALDRYLIEAWERRSMRNPEMAKSGLLTLDSWATSLEKQFAEATDEDKPTFAPALREVYWLLIEHAREYYASGSGYFATKDRVIRGLTAIEASASIDSPGATLLDSGDGTSNPEEK